jgi:hypothetical protein
MQGGAILEVILAVNRSLIDALENLRLKCWDGGNKT